MNKMRHEKEAQLDCCQGA